MAYISLVTELIALIILLVYVGAMAVLFIYVRAVSPNKVLAYSTNNLILLFFFLFILVSLLVLSPSLYSQCTGPSNLNIIVEIFSGWGIYLSFFVVSTLIIILAAVTFMSPSSSTFRCRN